MPDRIIHRDAASEGVSVLGTSAMDYGHEPFTYLSSVHEIGNLRPFPLSAWGARRAAALYGATITLHEARR